MDDRFGYSVAISGNYAIVGVYLEDGTSNFTSSSGAAYIFQRNTSTGVWNEIRIFRASNLAPGVNFGTSVAISGEYAIIGAPYEDNNSTYTNNKTGSAYF